MQKFILLAEDSADDAEVFKDTLHRVGIINPVHVVLSGEETICYLKGEGRFTDRERFPYPTVLFLDLLMPQSDGWMVLKWLHANPSKSHLRIIVLTGAAQIGLLDEAYRLGANSFLFKPLQKLELEALLHYWPEVWMLDAAKLPLPAPSRS